MVTTRLAKSALCIGIRSGAAARDCWRVAGDGSSIPAETVAGVFVCLGSDYLRGGRVSRRMGGGSFPPDVLSNLATRYHRAGGQFLAAASRRRGNRKMQ